MSTDRRAFLRGAAAAAGLFGAQRLVAQPPPDDPHAGHTMHPPGHASDPAADPDPTVDWRPEGAQPYLPVEAPDLGRLPWEW
ncbi:MAG TPA: twin-arginine translocation signal domain-containing protein, partial [Thermoanaerobaculia bacterium]|nr:twin-arginine translocation signal domain-containing protein [Thermoanaerobaculia bacterium]